MAEVQERAIPFDVSLTLNGAARRVKPLSLADVAEMGRVAQMRDVEEVRILVNRLLDDAPAGTPALADEQLMPALLAISIGFGEHLKKKSRILEGAIRASMAGANSTSGSSST